MTRLTNDDRRLGPLTWGRSGWDPWRIVLSSGDEEEGRARNSLTVYAFGWCARLWLPAVLQPHRVKVHAKYWDAATIERVGRDWYCETHPREFGFSLHEGFLQVFYGRQTGDSATTQSWSKHLPWTQWRHVRLSLYDLEGNHFWTEPQPCLDWEERHRMRDAVPKARFEFTDYDGKRIVATTHIEEREWRLGEGWFKWLSLFRQPKIRPSLDIAFSEEVGPEKGSWKGGTIGHGIDMLPGELHEAAFRRYCEQNQRSKGGRYRITFVGVVPGEAT